MDKKWNLQDIKSNSRSTQKPLKETVQREPAGTEYGQTTTYSASDTTINTVPTSSYENENVATEPSLRSRPAAPREQQKKRSWIKYVIGTVVAGAVIFFVAGQFTAKTELVVEPRTNEPNLNSEFAAHLAPERDQLGYDVLTIEAEGERQVASSGEVEEVSENASGSITIYKNTSGEQRLVATTRFEDANGRIYRITEPVTIPGGSSDAPGTVTVGITADAAGEEYNAPANTRFTVPGLKADAALFSAIYAENTAAFTGGFEGSRVQVSDDELSAAQEGIRNELQTSLREKITTERPADFISFNGSEKFAYETLPTTTSSSDTAIVKEKVSLQIPIFHKESLAKFLATALVTSYEGGPIRVEDYSKINFAYTASSSEQTTLSEEDTITFTMTGRPLLVWEYDQKNLETDLLGASEENLQKILGTYPAIDSAEATFAPFWKKSFPDSAAKITITEVIK